MSKPPKSPMPRARAMSAAMTEVLADALAIQDRFVPEPLLKTTGRGGLKSRGAESMPAEARELARKLSRAGKKSKS